MTQQLDEKQRQKEAPLQGLAASLSVSLRLAGTFCFVQFVIQAAN